MKKVIIDTISTDHETSGSVKNSEEINLLDNEEILCICASDDSMYLFTERHVNKTEKVYYYISDGRRSMPYDELVIPKFSSDGKAMAYGYRLGNLWFIADKCKISGPYDEITLPVLSSDGLVVLYSYRLGNEWFIVEKDNVSGPYDKVSGCDYTAEGKISLFKAEMEGRWYLISRHGVWEEVEDSSKLVFDFVEISGEYRYYASYDKNKSKHYLVTDKSAYGPYDGVTLRKYNGGNSTAVIACDKTLNEYYVILDNTVKGPFNNVSALGNENDKGEFKFRADIDGEQYLYMGDLKRGPYKEIIDYGLIGKKLNRFYAAVRKSRDKETEIKVKSIFSLRNNEKSVEFYKKNYRTWWVLTDDDEQGPYDHVTGPFLKPENGDNCYFAHKDNTVSLYDRNGIIAGPYNSIELFFLFLSNSEPLLSYHAKIDDKWYYIRNGVRSEPFDNLNFSNIKYNRQTGIDLFAAEINSKKYLFIGDKKTGPYDDIIAIGRELHNGKCRYIARVNHKFFLFTEEINFEIDLLPGTVSFCCDDNVIYKTPDGITSYSDDRLHYIINGTTLAGPYRNVFTRTTDDGRISGFNMESFVESKDGFKIPDDLSGLDLERYKKAFSRTKDNYPCNFERYLMIDGEEYGPYDRCSVEGVLDNGLLVAIVSSDGNDFIVAGNSIIGPYKEIRNFRFTASNSDFAYSVIKEDGNYFCLNGAELGPFKDIFPIIALPATDDFIFKHSELENIYFLIFRGKEYGPFGVILESGISQSIDGKIIQFHSWYDSGRKNYLIMDDALTQGTIACNGNTAYAIRIKE